jgi:hypothetical protein
MTNPVIELMNNFNTTMTSVTHMNDTDQSPDVMVVIVSFVWSLIIFTGVIGNGLVIYILFRYGERSVTNVYVINLAFADLMFIVMVVPVTLIHIVIPTWILGTAICKCSMYMIYVSKIKVMQYFRIEITLVQKKNNSTNSMMKHILM